MKKYLIVFYLALFLVSGSEARAGWIIRMQSTTSDGDVSYQTLMIEDGKIRSESEGNIYIFDLKANRLIMIDNASQLFLEEKLSGLRSTYHKATVSFIQQFIHQLNTQEQKMYGQLFAEMEKMYEPIDPVSLEKINISIKNTGEKDEIAGYPAEKYIVSVDDVEVEQIWLAPTLDVSSEIDLVKISGIFGDLRPVVGEEILYEYTSAYISLLKKGFEMRSIDVHGDKNEVQHVERHQIDNELFSVPHGYKKITLEELMMRQMGNMDTDEK
ncbi:MAG TPA: DUF4412 domain-containing protein [Bacteroidales bacterium]|nr:DUF4412 domain-containing protein [Bacteroidales bacterium]